jgi:hypothetical protein
MPKEVHGQDLLLEILQNSWAAKCLLTAFKIVLPIWHVEKLLWRHHGLLDAHTMHHVNALLELPPAVVSRRLLVPANIHCDAGPFRDPQFYWPSIERSQTLPTRSRYGIRLPHTNQVHPIIVGHLPHIPLLPSTHGPHLQAAILVLFSIKLHPLRGLDLLLLGGNEMAAPQPVLLSIFLLVSAIINLLQLVTWKSEEQTTL